MKTEKKSKEIETAEKIVKKYGRQNFVSNLCASDLFVITKRKGMFTKPKETYMIISERCARQIIARYKLYQYKNLLENNSKQFIYNNILLKNVNFTQLLKYINRCYDNKNDDENFDSKVQELVNILDEIIFKGDNKQNIVCVTANDETTVRLYTLFSEIKKYTSKTTDEITL